MAKHRQRPIFYFDIFGVETPPLFLEEHVDLCSNERIEQYDESYCGAYCLYMIYLIDRGLRIKIALNILVNQVKCPEIYNECFCLGCFVNDIANDNVNDKDNYNDNDNEMTLIMIMIMIMIILMIMIMIMIMIYEVALLIMIMIMIMIEINLYIYL